MWPLLLLSILAVAIMIERGLVYLVARSGYDSLINALEGLVRAGRQREAIDYCRGRRGPMARLAAEFLERIAQPAEVRQEALERVASEQLVQVGKRLNWLATIGQLAPMLGLLGTVTGLVTAFWQIEVKAGNVQPGDLASGIWEALITTVFGLIIAVPTLAAYQAFDSRLALTELRMQWLLAHLGEWMSSQEPTAKPPHANETRRQGDRAAELVGSR